MSTEDLRALSVQQPWAWAIAHGRKEVENRTWTTKYQGRLALHASKKWDSSAEPFRPLRSAWSRHGRGNLHRRNSQIHTQAVVAVATLTDVCSASADLHPFAPLACGCGPWAAAGQHHFLLEKVRPLTDPVPVPGRLGLWPLPEDVRQQVEEAFR